MFSETAGLRDIALVLLVLASPPPQGCTHPQPYRLLRCTLAGRALAAHHDACRPGGSVKARAAPGGRPVEWPPASRPACRTWRAVPPCVHAVPTASCGRRPAPRRRWGRRICAILRPPRALWQFVRAGAPPAAWARPRCCTAAPMCADTPASAPVRAVLGAHDGVAACRLPSSRAGLRLFAL